MRIKHDEHSGWQKKRISSMHEYNFPKGLKEEGKREEGKRGKVRRKMKI